MTRPDRLAALLLGLALAVPAGAQMPGDRNAPISIEADSAVIDEPAGTAVYRGRVVLVQGNTTLKADELSLLVVDGKAQKAVATGKPVVLDQAKTKTAEASHAEALRMTFLITEDRMLLEQKASLRQGEKYFQGERIDYNTALRRVNASGGANSRVLLVLPPTDPEKQRKGGKDKDKDKEKDGKRQRTTLEPAAAPAGDAAAAP